MLNRAVDYCGTRRMSSIYLGSIASRDGIAVREAWKTYRGGCPSEYGHWYVAFVNDMYNTY